MKARHVPVASASWDDLVRNFTGSRTETRELVDYCRVFSAEDAIAWAVQAYNEASRLLRSPFGERNGEISSDVVGQWVESGVPWSSPKGFADDFAHAFERRVWNACARSDRFREVEQWFGRDAVFCAPQGDNLPLRSKITVGMKMGAPGDST